MPERRVPTEQEQRAKRGAFIHGANWRGLHPDSGQDEIHQAAQERFPIYREFPRRIELSSGAYAQVEPLEDGGYEVRIRRGVTGKRSVVHLLTDEDLAKLAELRSRPTEYRKMKS